MLSIIIYIKLIISYRRYLDIGDLVEKQDHTFSILSGGFSKGNNKYILTGSVDKTSKLYDFTDI